MVERAKYTQPCDLQRFELRNRNRLTYKKNAMNNYDFAIIGNCTSAALLSSDCSVDWLCLPFFDSPSIFARILDKNNGGYFRISALNIINIRQNYVPHTPLLMTLF